MITNKYASCGLTGFPPERVWRIYQKGNFRTENEGAGSISVSSVFCLLMTHFTTSPTCEITKIQLYILKISLTPGYSRDVLLKSQE